MIAPYLLLIDRAVELLAEAVVVDDEGQEAERTAAEIKTHRDVLAKATNPQDVGRAGDECLKRCRAALTKARARRLAQRAEMRSLVEMVNEAVSTIAGYNSTFSSSLDSSTRRFDAMSRVNDLSQLKAQLAAEVSSLRAMAAERKQAWSSTVSSLENRLVHLEQKLTETEHEAAMDPLTGVHNRRGFDRVCEEWLHGGRAQFVLAVFDVDAFKQINDTHGHPMGDRVLVALAEKLKATFREGDIVARFGGDEFAVLAAGLTLRQAESRFRSVLAMLPGVSPMPDQQPPLTMSCGVAECSAGDTKDSLAQRADQALYDAKKAGKNRVATKATKFISDPKRR